MPESRISAAAWSRARAAMLFGLALLPSPALAQYIGGGRPPPLPPAPLAGQVETPSAALARALRTLAQSPRDFTALIAAGRAALNLGDMQSAIGFFGRAEEIRPSDPAPKIGMGAATVSSGDAAGALSWFYQAQQLGATATTIGADRGLAQDLLGNQPAAQLDYRAALGGRDADEARRRLALSLGISGDRNGAFSILQPLLMRRDPAARRIRAFVLALVGDERGASTAIDGAMPGSGARMAGFFRLLPNLSAPQKAAAVHLGIFPDPSEIRVAAVSPRMFAAPVPTRQAPQAAPPATRPSPVVAQPAPRPAFTSPPRTIVVDPDDRSSVSAFKFKRREVRAVVPTAQSKRSLPSASAGPAPRPSFSTVDVAPVNSVSSEPLAAEPINDRPSSEPSSAATTAALPTAAPEPEPAPPIVAPSGDRLSGIDRLLAQADELPVPPASRPRFEKAAKVADNAKAKKAAEVKKAAEAKKLADAKQAAEEKSARESIGVAGTNWVQLAGGSHEERMATEFRKLAAKSSALRKRGGHVTQGKDYYRLLAGPFTSKSEAQSFVNQLAKDDVDGFSWTRTPATLRIEKLSPK